MKKTTDEKCRILVANKFEKNALVDSSDIKPNILIDYLNKVKLTRNIRFNCETFSKEADYSRVRTRILSTFVRSIYEIIGDDHLVVFETDEWDFNESDIYLSIYMDCDYKKAIRYFKYIYQIIDNYCFSQILSTAKIKFSYIAANDATRLNHDADRIINHYLNPFKYNGVIPMSLYRDIFISKNGTIVEDKINIRPYGLCWITSIVIKHGVLKKDALRMIQIGIKYLENQLGHVPGGSIHSMQRLCEDPTLKTSEHQ